MTNYFVLLLACCLFGCINNTPISPLDFEIQVNSGTYASLNTAGNYRRVNGVLVINVDGKKYAAISPTCSYEGTTLTYQATTQKVVCPVDGSVFDLYGNVVSGKASSSIPVYQTSVRTDDKQNIYVHIFD